MLRTRVWHYVNLSNYFATHQVSKSFKYVGTGTYEKAIYHNIHIYLMKMQLIVIYIFIY